MYIKKITIRIILKINIALLQKLKKDKYYKYLYSYI